MFPLLPPSKYSIYHEVGFSVRNSMIPVILVIDMLRGFMEEPFPLYCGSRARAIIPRVISLFKSLPEKEIIYICDHHQPDDPEFAIFPPHCLRGTAEAEIIPELKDFPGTIVPKRRFSGFYGTPLEELLKKISPFKVIVVGVCTDICVMFTVADLRNRDYQVEVPRDCVASFDQEAHNFALKHMEKVLGARIV
jgi:nicotinamidase-related amidase